MYKEELSAVDAVDQLLKRALEIGASDIHLEPLEDGLRARMRVDGMLQDELVLPDDLKQSVISRIKVLAHIDIAQHRIPLDGKFFMVFRDQEVDFRISTFPVLHGEKIVIRILDKAQMNIELDQLGFNSQMLEQLKTLLVRPQGFFLVTGPTGSGKTTTLYSVLSLLNSPDRNIVTLEDPVEYSIDGITQGYINTATGFTFAKGIRALLRQDPDIIMVGEIRDQESARIAIEAAMTGHLVFSTLHTNDAPSSIIRLMDMGIEPYLISASVTGVLAQRLARKNCLHCIRARAITDDEKDFLEQKSFKAPECLFEGIGCDSCLGTGYHQRIGIFELLVMDDELRSFVNEHPRPEQFYDQARRSGMSSLYEDGFVKLKDGVISLAEFIRVLP
jgi:type II secretory ATPase GspE/PulE/Tfp pilus assembly ATPase PilB-like protein